MRDAIKATPLDLNSAYQNTIDRIKHLPREPKAQQALSVRKWVFLARRRLTVKEICHALGVRPTDRTLDTKGLPSEKALLDGCLGLITVDEKPNGKYLRLVHKTLQDYLNVQHEARKIFESGHNDIANTCLTYLRLEHESAETRLRYQDLLEAYPFLEYSVENWAYHLKKSSNPNIENCWDTFSKILSLKYCISHNIHPWMNTEDRQKHVNGPWVNKRSQPVLDAPARATPNSPLHHFAYFGIVGKVVEDRITTLTEDIINSQTYPGGYTALIMATRNRHDSFVRILLKRMDLNVNLPDDYRGTPLSYAITNSGHENHKSTFRESRYLCQR
jgi:hypothetical protein